MKPWEEAAVVTVPQPAKAAAKPWEEAAGIAPTKSVAENIVRGVPGTVRDVGLAFSGLGRGAIDMLNTAGSIPMRMMEAGGSLPEGYQEQAAKAAETDLANIGVKVRPGNETDEMLDSMARGAGAAAVPLPGSTLRQLPRALMAGAAAGGVGGEVAKTNPALGAGAGFLTGLAAHTGTGIIKTPAATKGVRSTIDAAGMPAMEEATQRAGRTAQTLGIDRRDVLPTQGLRDATPAQGLTNLLMADADTAGQMHGKFNRAQTAGIGKSQEFINGIAAKPGQGEANRVRDVMREVTVDEPARLRAELPREFYQEGEKWNFSRQARLEAPSRLQAVLDTLNELDKSPVALTFKRQMRALIGEDAKGNPILTGTPTQVENFTKTLRDRITSLTKDGASGAKTDAKRGYQAAEGELKAIVNEAAPSIERGRAESARLAKIGGEIQETALGKVTPGDKSAPADWKGLNKVLAESENYSPKDLTSMARNLANKDREAFPTMLRQHFETKLKGIPQGGRDASTSEIATTLFGHAKSSEREHMMTAIAEAARSQGKDPAAARRGAEALADALEVVSHDRAGMGVLTQEAGKKVLRAGFGWRGPYVNASENLMGGASVNAKKVLEALTAPDAMDRLTKISQFSLAGNRLKAGLKAAQAAGAVEGKSDGITTE